MSGGRSDYYSEDATFSAPAAKTQQNRPSDLSQAKTANKSLRELDDGEIEGLLSNLSTAELEDLNNDFDPDNSMLPPSQRCRDQTDKTPTGPYKREQLLKYLEDSAKAEKDWEDVVPFKAGLKRGKVFEETITTDNMAAIGAALGLDIGTTGTRTPKAGPGVMEMPIELDIEDEEDEDDLDEAVDRAPEKDLVDLAGILGMHNILNQPQFFNALKGKPQSDETCSFGGIIRAPVPKVLPDEPENETDVDECIKRLEENDENMREVNLNNMKRVSKERIRALIEACCCSEHVEKLSLANTAISDSEARGLVQLVETSSSLRVLNIESNFVTPELLARLMRATLITQTLTEFHAENQRATVLGNQIEMDLMMSVEENETLLRVGVALQSMEARHRVSEALERNYERVRLRRLEAAGKKPA